MRESSQDGLGQYRGAELNSIHVVGYGILLMRKANAEPAEGLSSAEAPDPRVAALRAAVNRAESSMFPNSRSSMSARSGGCPELRSTATDGTAGTATGERRDARFTRDFSHRQLAWCPPSRHECLRQRVLTSRAIQRRVFSITSFVIILRRFAHRQPRCARGKACRDSLSASFESSSRAGVWPRDLPFSLRRVRPRSPRSLLVQGTGLLPDLRRATHGRTCGTPR
jgi:hypothetical protein